MLDSGLLVCGHHLELQMSDLSRTVADVMQQMIVVRRVDYVLNYWWFFIVGIVIGLMAR